MSEIKQSKVLTKISCPKCSHEKNISISTYKNNSKLKCPIPECGTEFTYKLNCSFDSHQYEDISPDAFTHPLDRKTISVLRKVPGIDFALRKMMEYGYEKILRINSMADDVKVTPTTCGYIHDMVEQACKCLGITLPDVFINQNPYPNAFTFGDKYPLISIQSGLIELLTEDELYAVIAHEVTHIKCHHVLYHMLANFLVNASSLLGIVGGFIIPLNLALLEWSRKAELSADRGSLMITNNKDASIKFLMKLAGGSAQLSEMIDQSEFITQAQQFEKMTEGINLNKFFRMASNITRTHPFPVLRAYEINKWADGEEYALIFNGDYKKQESEKAKKTHKIKKCPHCGKEIKSEIKYCDGCGQNPNKLKNQYGKVGFENLKNGIKGGIKDAKEFFVNKKNEEMMLDVKKVCPICKTEFHDDPHRKVCPIDGMRLVEDQTE